MTESTVFESLEFDQIRAKLKTLAPSALSKKMAEELVPSNVPEIVCRHLDETEEAVILLQKEISAPLGETHDIFPLLQNASKDIVLLPTEFNDILVSLETYKKMHHYFEGERHLIYPLLEELSSLIIPQDELINSIQRVFDEKGQIRDSASPKLLRIRAEKESIKNKIRKSFQNLLTDKSIADYFQDTVVTQRNGRFVVPIKEEYRNRFDGIVHDRSSTGQTVFMEPLTSIQLNNDLTELKAAEKEVIHEILLQLSHKIKNSREVIENNCKIATQLEFIFAKAQLALSMNGTKAILSANGNLELRQARHPLIAKDKVVPITILLGTKYKILIITGANAGGKTIALKTVGLFALMNQSGLFIPAAEGSVMPVYTHVFSIIGDEQSIQYNLSTFSSYITHLNDILKNVKDSDLVLLDELGSGTDPLEGAALAQSVTEYLQAAGASCIITSHFSELKKMAYESKGIENAFVEFDEEKLLPKYHLIIGAAGNSNAFSICSRLGIPPMILSRAVQLKEGSPLHHMEKVMEQLNHQRVELEHEQEELKDTLSRTEDLKKNLEEEKKFLDAKRDSILRKTREEAENIKRNLRVESEQIIKELKQKKNALPKENLNDYISQVRNSVNKIKLPNDPHGRIPLPKEKMQTGMYVYIDTLGNDGIIQKIKRDKITVQCGMITVNVTPDHCFTASRKTTKTSPAAFPKPKPAFSVRTIPTTLNIIGKTVDEAVPLVDRFLNDAFMAGISPVQIIHGKGTGKLRKGIWDYLRNINFVSEFHSSDPRNGGAGATDVYF